MTIGPVGFFDDQFEATCDEDNTLQAAAREAGWALSTLVDEIRFEKRQQVVNIINRLSAALAYNSSIASTDEELPYQCDACSTPGYGPDAPCHCSPSPKTREDNPHQPSAAQGSTTSTEGQADE